MNKHSKFTAAVSSPLGGDSTAARAVESAAVTGAFAQPPLSEAPAPLSKMPCLSCEGKGEAEYMGLTEDRYHWRDCHVCDGTGLVEPYCETCEGKLTVDGFCYSCDSYPEGLVYVERIAPGRIAL